MMILNNAVITTAGTFTGPTYQLREPAGHGPPMFLEFQETFTFGSGAAVTADVYIQTSFDGGLTWCDAIHYAQLATASARFIAAVGQAGLAPVAPTSVLQEGRGNANIDAGLRFIWRISAHDNSLQERPAACHPAAKPIEATSPLDHSFSLLSFHPQTS